MDLVSEYKIIRITNKKNGLFKELDFNKYTKDDILKMIEFYNYRLLNFSLNIYDKFSIKKRGKKWLRLWLKLKNLNTKKLKT